MHSLQLFTLIAIALLNICFNVAAIPRGPQGAHVVNEAMELDCNENTPCKALHENCKDGHCKCEAGYIRNEHHCFPERKHGETCFFDIQCNIHPMVCAEQEQSSVKRCDCHRFYKWSPDLSSCILAENVSAMISGLQEQTFTAERIAAQAHQIFPGMVAAGILVLVLGSVLALGCVMYGCFWDHCGSQCRRPIEDEPTGKLEQVTTSPQATTSTV